MINKSAGLAGGSLQSWVTYAWSVWYGACQFELVHDDQQAEERPQLFLFSVLETRVNQGLGSH